GGGVLGRYLGRGQQPPVRGLGVGTQVTGEQDARRRRRRALFGRHHLAQNSVELVGHFVRGLEPIGWVRRGGSLQETVQRVVLGVEGHRVLRWERVLESALIAL